MSESFVQTKSSLTREVKPVEFQEVVFNSYKKKVSDGPSNTPVTKRKKPEPVPERGNDHAAFMKRARHEVIKFGLTGFDAVSKLKTKEALAVSLGAKPRKKKVVNYKEFKETQKKEKEDAKEQRRLEFLGKTKSGHASAVITNRKKAGKQGSSGDNRGKFKPRGAKDGVGGILGIYGKVTKQPPPRKLGR